VIVFLIPIILIMAALEFYLSNIPNSYKWKKESIKNLAQVEVLVFGSSRALGGLNPKYFSMPTINLANNSQSLYYDVSLLRHYKSDLKNLKVVIFEMSFYNLYYTMDEGFEPWRSKFYYKYWGFQPQIHGRLFFYDILYINLYPLSQIHTVKNRADSFNPDAESNGYLKDLSVLTQYQMENANKRYMSLKEAFYDSESIQLNIDLLDKVINELNAENIKVIFVQYPYWHGFNNCIDEEWIKRNDSIYNTWTENCAVQYFDFSGLKLADELYADVDHINYLGAELLSRKVDSIIMSLQ
jgi:hypothetical protein